MLRFQECYGLLPKTLVSYIHAQCRRALHVGVHSIEQRVPILLSFERYSLLCPSDTNYCELVHRLPLGVYTGCGGGGAGMYKSQPPLFHDHRDLRVCVGEQSSLRLRRSVIQRFRSSVRGKRRGCSKILEGPPVAGGHGTSSRPLIFCDFFRIYGMILPCACAVPANPACTVQSLLDRSGSELAPMLAWEQPDPIVSPSERIGSTRSGSDVTST